MNRLKELRLEHKITQTNIAKLLEMKQNGYCKYENECSMIPTKKLKLLARYYNTNIDYIFGLTDIKKPYENSKVVPINNDMNRLKEIRENEDLIQSDISKVINMSRNGYSHYETNEHDIPNKILIKLAIYYNVPIDYILYMTDEREPFKRNSLN